MADGFLEKKHAATPRRRQQARQQGQVAVSQDLTSAALLLAAVGAIWFCGDNLASQLAASISHSLTAPVISGFDLPTATHWFVQLAGTLAIAVVPILTIVMLTGVLVNLMQTGLILTPSRITPRLGNISPTSGIKRVFSIKGAARFGFGLLKVAVIVAVAFVAARNYGGAILSLDAMAAPQIAGSLFQLVIGTCLWIGCALFALALLDYGFQRWRLEHDLMMTDEELRQELKETAGDPQIVDRRREMSRKFASSPATATFDADVVFIDHDGWTVGIRYDEATMDAPVVTTVSTRENPSILTAARRRGIPVQKQKLPPLDRDAVQIGHAIPSALYSLAAALLAIRPSHG